VDCFGDEGDASGSGSSLGEVLTSVIGLIWMGLDAETGDADTGDADTGSADMGDTDTGDADSNEVDTFRNDELCSSSNENLRVSEACGLQSDEILWLCDYKRLKPGSLQIKNHSRNLQVLCKPLCQH
jgi:hypothetical protein